jgi:hypothetical protein
MEKIYFVFFSLNGNLVVPTASALGQAPVPLTWALQRIIPPCYKDWLKTDDLK